MWTGLFAVFCGLGLLRSSNFPVFCSLGPVQSWSLAGPRTGPSNTNPAENPRVHNIDNNVVLVQQESRSEEKTSWRRLQFILLTTIPAGSVYVPLSEDHQKQGPHYCQYCGHVGSLQDHQPLVLKGPVLRTA
jgi:hypothetical protein